MLEIKRTSITRLKLGCEACALSSQRLEIKRTSITRLKLVQSAIADAFDWRNSWNQKNLDYEIETPVSALCVLPFLGLEIKRTSITRLKRILVCYDGVEAVNLKSKEPRLRDWNGRCRAFSVRRNRNLKSKEPRLRDWNAHNRRRVPYEVRLKSKEPRLRDWNEVEVEGESRLMVLEIKRTSITRLKP